MNIKKIAWVLAVILIGFVLLINIKYPQLVENSYKQGNLSVLNQLTQSHADQSLDFYLGKIDDLWIGPVGNVIMTLLFTAFCLLYIKDASFSVFCFSVFCFLALSKFNVLFYPPYGDALGGPFAEALWLAKNHFNYANLLQQPGYDAGGPKVYFFSIYPAYLAILLKLIPSTKIFLMVNHLLVFLMSAVVVSLSRSVILRNHSPSLANLTAVFLMTTALFQAQSEAINMEMPCLFFSMIAVDRLIDKKVGQATLWALLAGLVKGHGIVICWTVALVAVVLFLIDQKNKGRKKLLLYALLNILGSMAIVGSKYFLHDQHVSEGMIKAFTGWASLKSMALPYFYILSLFLWMAAMFFVRRDDRERGLCGERNFPALVIFVSAGMWFVLFLNFWAVSPRYMLELTPFLVLCVVYGCLTLPCVKKYSSVLLVMAIAVASVGSYGLFHRKLKANYHVLSERSLEYRNDLKLYVRLAHLMETKYKDFTVGAPFIMAQILAIPELGYVKKPLNVLAYSMPVHYENIKNFEGLAKVDIMRTVWIGLACQFETRGQLTYPVNQQYDRIIEELRIGDNWAVVFMGGMAIEERKHIIDVWYKRQIEKTLREH